MKNRNKFFEIFAAAAVLFAGCSNSINPQEKSLPGTVIIKPVLPGQGARYVSPELDSSNMIYYYYAKKAPSQTTDNNSYSDNYSGFLETKNNIFSDALKNRGYNVGNTVKVADGEYVFNVLGYTVSTSELITNVIDDINKLKNSNDQTQGQDLPSKYTVSGSVKVDCTNKTTVTVPMFWNGDYTGLGITTTTTVTSSYPNVKVVDALDFSYQFQSDDNSYANGNNGTTSNPTYDFCLKLTECIAQPNTEPIIVNLKTTDNNGNAVYDLIVEEKQNELGVITTTVKINPEYTEEITAGLWNIGFYKGGEIVSAYQYNTVMLVPGVKTTFNLDFNSNSPTSSVFVKIPEQSSGTAVGGSGTLLSPFIEFKYSLDTLENFPNTEVLLSDVEHNTPELFNESYTQRIVLDLNRFTLSAGIDIETSSAYPFTACNSTIKNGIVNAHLEMTNGGSLENVTFPGGSVASGVISDANIITIKGSDAEDVTNSIVYSFNNVKADYIQIKNPGVIIDSLVNGTNNIVKGIIIGEKGYSELPKIAKSWRIGNPNTDFRNISLFKYEEDNPEFKTFKIVPATDYTIKDGCIVYNAEPMGFIQGNEQFSFFNLDSNNNIKEIKVNPPSEGANLQYAASTFDLNGYPWVLVYNYNNTNSDSEYYIVNQDYSVNCKVLDLPDPSSLKIAVDNNYLYLYYAIFNYNLNEFERCLKRVSFAELAVGLEGVSFENMEFQVCTKALEVMVATGPSELYFIYYEPDEVTHENVYYLSKVIWDENGLQFDKDPICLNERLAEFFPKLTINTNDYLFHYELNGADADLVKQGYENKSDPAPSEVTVGEYNFCDLAYSNGKLYIPVDFKYKGEEYPVAISTGNIVVYDLTNKTFDKLGEKLNLDTDKIIIDLPRQTIDSTVPIPAKQDKFTLTGYYPTADTPNMFYGVNKILAINEEKIIFSDTGYCFLVDDFEKWKKALASDKDTPYIEDDRIKVKNINRALIYQNNGFTETNIPENYIDKYKEYFGSNSIAVGGIYDCNISGCSSLHAMKYKFYKNNF